MSKVGVVSAPVEIIRNLIQCFSYMTRSQSEAFCFIIEEGRIEYFTFSDWTCLIAIPDYFHRTRTPICLPSTPQSILAQHFLSESHGRLPGIEQTCLLLRPPCACT